MVALLTDDERNRFAAYLEQDAESSEVIAKQMESLPHLAALAKNLRVEAMAAKVVAKKLRSIESQAIREGK